MCSTLCFSLVCIYTCLCASMVYIDNLIQYCRYVVTLSMSKESLLITTGWGWCFRMTTMWWRQKSWKILNTMLFQSHQLSTSTKVSSPDQHLVHWVAACQHASTPQEPSTSVLYLTVITLRRYYRKNLMWGCVCICAVCVCECGVCVCACV